MLSRRQIPSVVASNTALTSDVVVKVVDGTGKAVQSAAVVLVPIQSEYSPRAYDHIPVNALGGLVEADAVQVWS